MIDHFESDDAAARDVEHHLTASMRSISSSLPTIDRERLISDVKSRRTSASRRHRAWSAGIVSAAAALILVVAGIAAATSPSPGQSVVASGSNGHGDSASSDAAGSFRGVPRLVTVSPDHGLKDGDTVRVTVRGLDFGTTLTAAQCGAFSSNGHRSDACLVRTGKPIVVPANPSGRSHTLDGVAPGQPMEPPSSRGTGRRGPGPTVSNPIVIEPRVPGRSTPPMPGSTTVVSFSMTVENPLRGNLEVLTGTGMDRASTKPPLSVSCRRRESSAGAVTRTPCVIAIRGTFSGGTALSTAPIAFGNDPLRPEPAPPGSIVPPISVDPPGSTPDASSPSPTSSVPPTSSVVQPGGPAITVDPPGTSLPGGQDAQVTVSPRVGLTNGQSIQVSLSGFVPGASLVVAQCAAMQTSSIDRYACLDRPGGTITIPSTGSITLTVTVVNPLSGDLTVYGPGGSPISTLTNPMNVSCNQPPYPASPLITNVRASCLIVVRAASGNQQVIAGAPIEFTSRGVVHPLAVRP